MKKLRPKNGIAKALRTPRYKMRVIRDKRIKSLIKEIRKLIREIR